MEQEHNYQETIKRFSNKLPHFPDGRIDYTNSKEAPALNCFVESNGKILLLKRSEKVGNYQGMWNSIGGYLDENKPLENKVKEELIEELDIKEENIADIKIGKAYAFHDEDIDKIWHIFPVLVKLKTEPKIKLDWEHTDFVWVKKEEIANYNTVPKLVEVLGHLNC